MLVKELIKELQKLPPLAQVFVFNPGENLHKTIVGAVVGNALINREPAKIDNADLGEYVRAVLIKYAGGEG